jgi:death-on-curing protein
VLVCRLAWSHPLPDGNKREAWASMAMFLDLNEVPWTSDPPDTDEAEAAMLAVAAHEVDEAWVADWLRSRARFPEPSHDGTRKAATE